ncbi:glycosyltransferase family 2 protein [Chryseobacterium lactis]|uniref:Glycosyltransferase family 2 protein n=1 Tax=Chryseobacterium lactis TaxID=1241981 RepID=A0A3G6RV48_CHRLC|nr:glycosyltransferase family A protein [Chryseobacterium lactis]AZA80398.1 glycosyltransferase family 2 protein [Chryseobacterium lactis]AZB05400.1 glycosyltransferase family 2 protein [Chryseobacterium lactis]PNW11549.1 glycosyltransferase family 2 protein [Chryseobacterium lactis]
MSQISIGISAYNTEKYIKYAIQSILAQSYRDFELIIINDGSTDNTSDEIKKFNDDRIVFIDDKENKGLIFRLNQLVKLSKNDFFIRMDADDIMFPDRLEKQIEILNTNRNADIIYSDAISINNKNEVLGYKKSYLIKNKKDILEGRAPIHPSVAIKRHVLLDNPYQEGFFQMEDMELWYRLAENYNFFNINEPLLFYREESTKISIKHKKMRKGLFNFTQKYFPDHFIFKNKIMLASNLKFYMYSILEFFNQENLLLKRRYSQLELPECRKYQEILNKVSLNG